MKRNREYDHDYNYANLLGNIILPIFIEKLDGHSGLNCIMVCRDWYQKFEHYINIGMEMNIQKNQSPFL
jgi:hypothetical protein